MIGISTSAETRRLPNVSTIQTANAHAGAPNGFAIHHEKHPYQNRRLLASGPSRGRNAVMRRIRV
jgi:hypothetical protein